MPTGVLWLRDLLPAFVPTARIMSFGYDSSLMPFRPGGTSGVADIARQLLVDLDGVRQDNQVLP
jgi:hypothetical protein